MKKLQSGLFLLSKRASRWFHGIQRYFLFVLQIVGWTLLLYTLVPLLAAFQPIFFNASAGLGMSDFILLITAAFVLAYTYQTQKLKEETILQRRMSVAHDVRFRMTSHYRKRTETDIVFGEVTTKEAFNNICNLTFVTAVIGARIGRSSTLQKITSQHDHLTANYFIETAEGREEFLKALQLNDGEIQARVLVTNGERFLYTFRAVTDNWKATLTGSPNLNDELILVKKELDEG